MRYTTKQLYGTDDLSILADMPEKESFPKRIEMLEEGKTIENNKSMYVRDAHLVKKIVDSQLYWQERIKEHKRNTQ